MVGKKFTCVLFSAVLALAGTVFAEGPHKSHAANPSRFVAPAQSLPASVKIIFSNLGPSTTDEYYDGAGYDILGPNNSLGFGEQWIAVPFTPKANAHVTALAAAVGWESGAKEVIVGLYADSGANSPGTLLASKESANIPDFDTCCSLVVVTVPSTAVTAGTQYWIGVTTDDTNAPDFSGVFMSSNEAETAFNPSQEGWFSFVNDVPAAAAGGTIP